MWTQIPPVAVDAAAERLQRVWKQTERARQVISDIAILPGTVLVGGLGVYMLELEKRRVQREARKAHRDVR